MSAFVQAVELWTPQGGELALHAGAYGAHTAFREASLGARFALGKGLPGCVWSSGKPQVWDSFEETTDFVRLPQAREAGLIAGVGIPITPGGRRAYGALTLLCAGGNDRVRGCIERWDVDRNLDELRHGGGYYGDLEAFGRSSMRMRFRDGMGLPGMCLELGRPLIQDTRESNSFLRAELARQSGVDVALGLPVYREGRVAHVMVLMSASGTPLARAFEIWEPVNGNVLRIEQAFYGEGLEEFAAQSRDLPIPVGQGLPGRAFRSEMPQVFDTLTDPRFLRNDAAERAGLNVGVAIPVHDGRDVISVVVLLS